MHWECAGVNQTNLPGAHESSTQLICRLGGAGGCSGSGAGLGHEKGRVAGACPSVSSLPAWPSSRCPQPSVGPVQQTPSCTEPPDEGPCPGGHTAPRAAPPCHVVTQRDTLGVLRDGGGTGGAGAAKQGDAPGERCVSQRRGSPRGGSGANPAGAAPGQPLLLSLPGGHPWEHPEGTAPHQAATTARLVAAVAIPPGLGALQCQQLSLIPTARTWPRG